MIPHCSGVFATLAHASRPPEWSRAPGLTSTPAARMLSVSYSLKVFPEPRRCSLGTAGPPSRGCTLDDFCQLLPAGLGLLTTRTVGSILGDAERSPRETENKHATSDEGLICRMSIVDTPRHKGRRRTEAERISYRKDLS